MATKRIVFTIGPAAFGVAIDLVARHHHRHLRAVEPAQGIQDVHGTHHIGSEGVARFPETRAHQRLSRQMENNLWARLPDKRGQRRGIARIAKVALANRADIGLGIKTSRHNS
jgi:hypothetical protein